ncbi:transcription factor MUTE-like [Lolium rigidum]|uniref:transcription factor MUTE-like n=1 Tax=Lolium rigidum TaxID=89674 RepID=UPI001F5D0E2E|nr:transcription factor MUTE-like [Lolium rigidum]
MSHIAVERNRRRQMNDHLKVLRALTPAFYIKRVDQASIIGGAIEFIKELHTVLEALEAKKKRRLCSPTPSPSPRSLLSCSTPTSAGVGSSSDVSPSSNGSNNSSSALAPFGLGAVKELAACCNSPAADVEARISGANVMLRTLSGRIPGQAARIVALLESLHLEVLQVNISTMDDTVLHSFVLKIGLECQLSVEDLAFEVQQTFLCYQEPDPNSDFSMCYPSMAI